ncbi:Hsp20/alpha crystallin family protein [Bacillus sp. B15-48]|uniref:Hsp20/alpha crystallin family protein n=1 Tax=Bacillus sp. B15-48 TaxID=1548601 RepID=UPI00193FB0CB|nr:Hsp20/alpha crystallin family protein [Bacillus sp. B15-48]MBM4761995.1 Hsp20/alpha crystallin family protein [Bacillus sp. B15-48]
MLPWNNFPFSDEMKKMLHSNGSTEIDKYVHEMLNKMMPKNMEGMANPQSWMKGMPAFQQESQQQSEDRQVQIAVFETHDFVFIRIPIEDEHWLKEMKIFYTSHELIIENIPKSEDKNTITLPVPVRKKGATATHRDCILEIKIPRSIQSQISEISVPDV